MMSSRIRQRSPSTNSSSGALESSRRYVFTRIVYIKDILSFFGPGDALLLWQLRGVNTHFFETIDCYMNEEVWFPLLRSVTALKNQVVRPDALSCPAATIAALKNQVVPPDALTSSAAVMESDAALYESIARFFRKALLSSERDARILEFLAERGRVRISSSSSSNNGACPIRVLLSENNRAGPGDQFLKYAKFSATDFAMLDNFSQIGANFCHMAEFDYGHDVAIDLSQMTDLRAIGHAAFSFARGVSTVLLPPSVERIGHSFCSNSSITELDLAPLKSLEFVDTRLFLSGCRRLSSFDTTPLLGKIGARVGECFFHDCTALVEVDLSGLAGVTEIEDWFLRDCTALKKVAGCEALSQVRIVRACFLCRTRSLEEFGFSKLTSLAQVGRACLNGSGLEVIGRGALNIIMFQNDTKKEKRVLPKYIPPKYE